MSVLLEVLGRGLHVELSGLLRRLYRQDRAEAARRRLAQMGKPLLAGKQDLAAGLSHWREGRLEQAQQALARACHHDPQSVPARAALACVFDELEDSAATLNELHVLNRRLPNQPAIQFALGLCYERLEQPGCAIIHYRQAVSLDETFVPACERLAAVSLYAGTFADAISQYQTLCRIRPEDPRLRTLLAAMLYRERHYDQAVEVFQGVVLLEPEHWAFQDENIAQRIAEGQFREAIEQTRSLLNEQGPFPDIYVQLADLYSLTGDDTPAVKYYLQAMDMQPAYLEAMIKLATHHLLFGRWDESAEAFGRAAEISEWSLINYLGLAMAATATDQRETASEWFRLAADMEPNGTLLLAQMIRLHWKLSAVGDSSCGADVWSQADRDDAVPETPLQNELTCHAERVRQEPSLAVARFHYGALLRATGQIEAASREMLQAVKLHPTYVPALIQLGIGLQERGRQDSAARVFHRLFQPVDHEIDYHYRLGVQFHRPRRLEAMADQLAASESHSVSRTDARSSLLLSLVNMGLLDRGAVTWRELSNTHRVTA